MAKEKDTKILLVVPRYNLTNKIDYRYGFPVGLGYISSVLKQKNYDVDCLNLNHHNGAVVEIMNRQLSKKKYDIICSGHTGIGYAVIEKIVKAAREHESKPKIILGGSLITSEPELMLKALQPDFEVIGEGERTIVELLDALENKKDLKSVNGIGFKDKSGKLVFTKPREVIIDLDSIPFPDFEGLGFEEQLGKQGSEALYGELDYPRVYPLLASRGCPFQCTFCYHCLGEKYRQRSLDNVMEELESAIKKWKINVIDMYDDLFSLDQKRLYEFCKRIKKIIKEVPWECKWNCTLSVRNVDKKMLEILKDSGCDMAGYGFESFSQEVLNSMKKPITPEQIDKAIKLTREVGMGIQANFIFGDVAETKETAKTTLDYWKKNGKGQILIGFIQPYPGSAIYNRCIEKGIIKDKLEFIKNKISHTNWINMTDKMTDKEILQLKKEIVESRRKYAYYLFPLNLKKVSKKRYDIHIKCPFCNKVMVYKNCFIGNKFYYSRLRSCRNCSMRFFAVSPLYKFTVDYYNELDFFRRNYLFVRDTLIKKRM